MCRVEERIYISRDGHRSKFEEAFPCDKAPRGKLCSKVKKKTVEYWPKKGSNGRDDTPSPLNPPTPTGSGPYITQPVRPSSSSERPSTREGQKSIKPEIIIEFGSKKDKGKKYLKSSQSQKRASFASDDAIESPGSDASYKVRTGFPEASLSPQAPIYGRTDDYISTPTAARPGHQRNVSSTSSYTGSSRTPSLYVTSDPDYDQPSNSRSTKHSTTVVHNPSLPAQSSPSKPRVHINQAAGDYKVTVMTPTYAQDTHADGLYPNDYPADRSASSYTSSVASGASRHGKEPARRKKQDDRKVQEDLDRDAEAKENVKQVRFELGRAEGRAKERAENKLAEAEKERAAAREEARRQKDAERESRKAPEPKKEKEKSRQPAAEPAKRPGKTRRASMTPAQAEEQRRLLLADVAHMQGESVAADARDREERTALLKQQQQDPSYYNPRTGGGMSSGMAAGNAVALGRRNSTSRRNSVSLTDAAPVLGRTNSSARRPHVVQPDPPAGTSQMTGPVVRQPSTRTHQPPPVSFPANFNRPPPSARRPSFSSQDNPSARRPSISTHENPFAAPPTRGSGSSIENPFAPGPQILSPSTMVHQDPWDLRNVSEALPSTRPVVDDHYTMERRGYDVINGVGSYHAAQQATRAMRSATGYAHDDYAVDSDEDRTHGHARRRR